MTIPKLAHIWHSLAARLEARKRAVTVVILIVAALPMLHIGKTIMRLGVDVPVMDDWEMAPVIANAHTGELTFHDLFKQEEEARMIVPKLVFIASTWRGHWDVRDQMMLSVFVCAAIAAGLFVLLRRSGLGLIASAVCFWLIVFVIFSPAQFELWLFASGLPSFMPMLFIVAALLLFGARMRLGAKFAFGAVLAAMSSFTLAHGLLAWGLTFPVYLLAVRANRWRGWAVAWILTAGICTAAYFHGYRKPRHLPDFAPVIGAMDYLQFLLAFLGGGFAYAVREQRVALAVAAGAIVLTLFIAAAVYVIFHWRDRELFRATAPWFALGLYAIASGVLATMGRIGFGLEYAISSRYVTFSLYLTVAVIALLPLIAKAMISLAREPGRLRLWFAVVTLLLVTAGACFYVPAWGRSMRIMESLSARNRLADAALLFSPVLDVAEIIKRTYPAAGTALERAARLDELGLRKRKLVRSREVTSLPTESADGKTAAGLFERISPADGDRVTASGWAALPANARPADAVVLTYELPATPPILFAICDEVVKRREVKKALRADEQLWSGWSATFLRAAVPAGASITAWAVDAREQKLYRLPQNAGEVKL